MIEDQEQFLVELKKTVIKYMDRQPEMIPHIAAALSIIYELGQRADDPHNQEEWATGLLMSELQPLVSSHANSDADNFNREALTLIWRHFPEGCRVHVDTQNDEWGRVTGEGTCQSPGGIGLLVNVDSIKADIFVPLTDLYKIEG